MKPSLPLYKMNRLVLIGVPAAVTVLTIFGLLSTYEWNLSPMEVVNTIFLPFVALVFSFMMVPLVTSAFTWRMPGELRPEGFVSLVEEARRVYGVNLSLAQADQLIGVGIRGGVAPWVAFQDVYVPTDTSFTRYGAVEGVNENGDYYHYQLVFMNNEWRLLDAGSDGPKELPRVDAPAPEPVTV